jgi:dihydrofolate synthase/folylpolyglutamate synthase
MPGPSLDRIRAVAELLDHPERTFPAVQVTGTNGKTTTARLVAALACAHGLTTGLFVSPHLSSVTERVSVCSLEISVAEFGEEYEHVLPFLRSVDDSVGPVTYFEAITALAFLWFADKPVGLGVFEVGMGGTWDATNLVRGEVAILTPVGLDHVRHLGSTVEQIATEKAGIIKPGAAVVVREQRPEALAVIRRRADELGATIRAEGTDFALASRARAVGGQLLEVRGLHASYQDLFVPQFGEASARNVAAAVAALESLLDRALDEGLVRRTLREATSPGRLEVVSRSPLVVLDGAHNPDAAEALAAALEEAFTWSRLHLVAAMFEDKDVERVIGLLAPLADLGYAASTDNQRAASTARLAEAMERAGLADVERFAAVPEAVRSAVDRAEEDDLILVTGSFYTVGDARPLFSGDAHDRG